jgi:hypothetical protein
MGLPLFSLTKWMVVLALLFSPLAFAQWTYDGMSIPLAHPRLFIPASSSQFTTSQTWLATNPLTPGTCDDNHIANCTNIAWKHALSGSDCSTAINWANASATTGTNLIAAFKGPAAASGHCAACDLSFLSKERSK